MRFHLSLLLLPACLNGLHQPVQPVVQPVAFDRTGGLDAPRAVLEGRQMQRLTHLRRIQGIRLVLLVGKDEQGGVAQLLLGQHGRQLLGAGGHPIAVGGVDDKNDGGRVGVVEAPVGADAGLPAEVPDVELEVAVGEGLDVEADGGHGGDDLADGQAHEDGRLARPVEAQQQDADLLVAPQTREDAREDVAHPLVTWLAAYLCTGGVGECQGLVRGACWDWLAVFRSVGGICRMPGIGCPLLMSPTMWLNEAGYASLPSSSSFLLLLQRRYSSRLMGSTVCE